MHEQCKSCNPAPMDHTASHPLPDVGSFPYSWPTSKPKAQLDRRGDIAAFIETDPASPPQGSFDFRLSLPEQTAAMADADQMFHGGLLLPLQLARHGGGEDGHKQPVLLRSRSLDSSQRMMFSASKRHQLSRPASLNSSPYSLRYRAAATARSSSVKDAVFRNSKLRLPSFVRCGKQHKWNPFRYLSFLVPSYQKIVTRIRRSKADDDSHHAEHCNGKVCDLSDETAIRDAILHCKRSL